MNKGWGRVTRGGKSLPLWAFAGGGLWDRRGSRRGTGEGATQGCERQRFRSLMEHCGMLMQVFEDNTRHLLHGDGTACWVAYGEGIEDACRIARNEPIEKP